jgi:hypothetical protein
LTARRPTPGTGPTARASNRACSENGCITRLSRYNTAEYCYLHAPVRFPRFRGQFTSEYEANRA